MKKITSKLFSDIKTDRKNISYAIEHNEKRIKQLDSLGIIAADPKFNTKSQKEFYYYFLLTQGSGYTVKPIDRTIIQLKSTGEMRLIRKKSSLNEILDYETQKEGLLSQSDIYERYARKLTDYGLKIFNTNKFQYLIENRNILDRKDDHEKFELLTMEDSKILEFSNLAFINSSTLKHYILILKNTDKEAEKLLETLKTDYNLN